MRPLQMKCEVKIFITQLDKYWKTDIKTFMPEWEPYL